MGDALGVSFELSNRLTLQSNPVTEMMGGLMYRKLLCTWSDDTSMTLCLLDSLSNGYSPEDVMRRFADWAYNNAYIASGTRALPLIERAALLSTGRRQRNSIFVAVAATRRYVTSFI